MSSPFSQLYFHALFCLVGAAICAADDSGFCLSGISQADGSGFAQGRRQIPPRSPALAAFDWDPSHTADRTQLTTNYTGCHVEAPIFRYRVAQGVVYLDHDHSADTRYHRYRVAFLEQLVLSVWLYEDFPDLDLVVDYSDHAQLCHQSIPFLRYSIFNTSLLGESHAYNTTELLSPEWIDGHYRVAAQSASNKPLPYTKGFTIPSPEAWWHLSLTPAQLADYTSCMDTTHPWSTKRHVIFWRGAATGCSRGWPLPKVPRPPPPAPGQSTAEKATQVEEVAQPPHLLRNKRTQMVLRLFPYPQAFDVGITSLPHLTPGCLGVGALLPNAEGEQQHASCPPARQQQEGGLDTELAQQQGTEMRCNKPSAGGRRIGNRGTVAKAYRAVARLLHKEPVGMEGWADAVGTQSIDGYGPAYRLPQQLLLGSAVLKVNSPYQMWLDWDLVPGMHYEQVAYDLSDLEQQGFSLLGAGSSLSLASEVATADNGNAAAAKGGGGGGSVVEGVSADGTCVGGAGASTCASKLKQMAGAARAVVIAKVNIFAQLDAFMWSVARYKEVCPWGVAVPEEGDKAWRVVQLNPGDVFNSKGVPESVQLQVMQHLQQNFADALKRPAYAQARRGG